MALHGDLRWPGSAPQGSVGGELLSALTLRGAGASEWMGTALLPGL
jgi:hypothetical protein